MVEVPVAFQSYESRSLPWSAQRLINLYYELGAEGTKTQGVLFNRPGKTLFGEIGDGPIRGIEKMGGVPFVVSGEEIYTVDEDGVGTLLGDLPGTDIVDMANNGEQVAINTEGDGYIATLTSVDKITDATFDNFVLSSVTYKSGYFIWTITDTTQFILSPILNGLGPYDASTIASAEVSSDDLVAAFSDRDDLFLMGADTIEPWQATGRADLPFQLQPGVVMEVGLSARDTVVKLGGAIFWLGSEGERGGQSVWSMAGYVPQRMSTHPLEKKWEELTDDEVSAAYAFSMRIEGHDFYVLTFPVLGTFVYDLSTQLWCEWVQNGAVDFQAVGHTDAYNQRIVGSAVDGKLHTLSVDVYTDEGGRVFRSAVTPAVSTGNNYLARHNFVRIDIETGVGLTDGDSADPEIQLRWSGNGETFGNWHTRSIGRKGERDLRVYWRQLGIDRTRFYEFRISDDVKTAILGAYVDIGEGFY